MTICARGITCCVGARRGRRPCRSSAAGCWSGDCCRPPTSAALIAASASKALAQRLARRAGMDPELCCGLRERRSTGYRPYIGGLRLWNGQQLQALEQVSPLVESLSHPQELAWVMHPREVRDQLRQQLPAANPQP
jgi:hypothetical protein